MADIGGRSEIENFYRGASSGVFTMDGTTASDCAEVVQVLIAGLQQERDAWLLGARVSFGGFQSASEMQAGFEDKAVALRVTLGQFIEAAERLKASFEMAGALIVRAEEDNANAVLASGEGIGP